MVRFPWMPGDQVLLWSLNVMLQITVIAAIALLVAMMLRRHAALRYALLCSALGVVLLCPLVAGLVQAAGISTLALAMIQSAAPTPVAVVQVADHGPARIEIENELPVDSEELHPLTNVEGLAHRPGRIHVDDGLHALSEMAASPVAANPAQGNLAPLPQTTATVGSHQPVVNGLAWLLGTVVLPLFGLWMLGALVFLTRLAIAWYRLLCLLRTARPNENQELRVAFHSACQRLGVRSDRAELVLSDRISGPLAAGLWRPKVLLAASLVERVSAQQLQEILVHELAHIVRRDQVVVLLQNIAGALFWPHPLVWSMNRQLAQAREEVCVNHVLAASDGASYSRTLLMMAELLTPPRAVAGAVGLFTSRWKLETRVAGLLDERRSRVTRLNKRGLALTAMVSLVLGCVIACGTITVNAAQEESDQPATPMAASQVADKPTDKPAASTEAKEADAPPAADSVAAHPDPRMAALIAEVAKAERLYDHLETTVRRENTLLGDKWTIPKSIETVHTIRQPNRFFCELKREDLALTGPIVYESAAAFDGETTTAIEYKNSANRLTYRYEPSYDFPPHTWAIAHLQVNFPLSIYLRGTEALRTHHKVRTIPVERGSTFEFNRVECEYVGEERIGDLDCVKVRVNRWYYTTEQPSEQILWLARDRNHLCIKSQNGLNLNGKLTILIESNVARLEMIRPDVWLPVETMARHFDYAESIKGNSVASKSTESVLQSANATPIHVDTKFQLAVPNGLPLYVIGPEGNIDGPHHPLATENKSSTTMAEIIENIRKAERFYENLELTVVESYRTSEVENNHVDSNMFVLNAIDSRTHSVSLGTRHYVHEVKEQPQKNAPAYITRTTQASDGSATRMLRISDRLKTGDFQIESAMLEPEGTHAPNLVRPHTMLQPNDSERRSLSELMADEWRDKKQGLRQLWSYEGDDLIDGMPCYRIRCDILRDQGKVSRSRFYWIAPQRNYLCVRVESRDGGKSSTLPTALHTVESFKELAPGIWIPEQFRAVLFRWFSQDGLCENRLIHSWQRDFHVESATLEPKVDDSLFSDISAPKGTKVSVRDKSGEFLGRFELAEDGPLTIAPDKLNELKATAKLDREAEAKRIAALEALIGKPAPEFPTTQWLNSEPLSWAGLKGKVVVVDFWALWCGPCTPDLKRLSELQKIHAANGITKPMILGIHTAGSSLEEVTASVKQHDIGYPVCMDANPTAGTGWGELFNQFAVHQMPIAMVVDQNGNVVAHGRLEEMLSKAAGLVQSAKDANSSQGKEE